MNYLTNTDEVQEIWIPKFYAETPITLTLTLHSTIGLEDIIITATDVSNYDGYFVYELNPVSAGLTTGEWEYTLKDGNDNLFSAGVISVTENVLEYQKVYDKSVTYEQYRDSD